MFNPDRVSSASAQSLPLLQDANQLALLSGHQEPIVQRATARGSILLAAASVEALINDIVFDLFDGRGIFHPSYCDQFSPDVVERFKSVAEVVGFERLEVKKKLDLLLLLTGVDLIGKGDSPRTEWQLLVRIRNALIHPGPHANLTSASNGTVSNSRIAGEVHSQLGRRLPMSPDIAGYFPNAILSREGAAWAVEVATKMQNAIKQACGWVGPGG